MNRLIIALLLITGGCEVVYTEDDPTYGLGSGCAFEGAMMRADYSAHISNDSIKCPNYVTALETWTWQDTDDFSLRLSVYQESYDGFAEPTCHGTRRSTQCSMYFEVICDNGDTASADTELIGTDVIRGTFTQHDAAGWSCGYDVTYSPL